MTKLELIKALEQFNDDSIVIIGDSNTGWSNIGELKNDGSSIAIMSDYTLPFSSDN